MAAAVKVPLEGLHAYLGQYRAEIQRDVSTNKGHIYFSRPTGKWLLVRRTGKTCSISFHNDCPCDQV